MKQIDVEIMGQSYRLSCPAGGEARLLQAVQRVDAAMCKIRDGGKVRARDRIAVLAALNLAFDIADNQASNAATTTATKPEPPPSQEWHLTDPDSQHKLDTLIQRLDTALV
jgi:cell division protein ZapA